MKFTTEKCNIKKQQFFFLKTVMKTVIAITPTKLRFTHSSVPPYLGRARSWLADRARGFPGRRPSALLRELLEDELLNSPCSIFCFDTSRLPSKASAWDLKCSANPQNALWTDKTDDVCYNSMILWNNIIFTNKQQSGNWSPFP